MKVMLLADEPEGRLWDYLDRSALKGIDLIISCGDLPAEYLSFITSFTSAPLLYVHGNHDAAYEDNPPEGCICIEDRVFNYKGLRIVGLGGSMRYKPGPYQYTDREMAWRICRLRFPLLRSKGFDILAAHAPIHGIGDAPDLCHNGFRSFRTMLDRYHPAWFVHGHVHATYDYSAFQRIRAYGDTTVVNAWRSFTIDAKLSEGAVIPKKQKYE